MLRQVAPRDETSCHRAESTIAGDDLLVLVQLERDLHPYYLRGPFPSPSWSNPAHGNKENGLLDLFSEIITNPAHWDSQQPDWLHVGRRLPPSAEPHNCAVGCLANMCKGDELDAYLVSHGGRDSFDRIVYVGDGGNDFCPLLRMRARDLALVRKGFELDARVREEGGRYGMNIEVRKWEQAWQVDEWVVPLIARSKLTRRPGISKHYDVQWVVLYKCVHEESLCLYRS